MQMNLRLKESMIMKIVTRSAEERDIDRVYEIELESFTTPWSYESIKIEIIDNPLSIYRLISVDDIVVGFGGFWIIGDEAHITNIAIKSEFRGLGYSKILMEDIINFCKNNKINSITLEVREGNIQAINLYEFFGFKVEGIRKGYYEDTHEDALIMWKYFDEN